MAENDRPYTTEEFTASDGYVWRFRRYRLHSSFQPPRPQVVFVHGIQSHAGWYEHSCTRLAEAGFAVSFLDRRGSGVNQQQRGDTPSFRRLLDDIAEYLRVLRGLPGKVFLAGISWGGKIVTALQRRHPGLIDGLLLFCPGFCSLIQSSLGQRLRILLARLFRPRKLFPLPLNDPELFTQTPRWLEFLRQDTLGLKKATARFLVESVRLDLYLRFVPPYVDMPVLMLLAEKDRIIDNARTRRYVERFASSDRTIIEYPGAHHTLEFEPDPEKFIGDVIAWLGKRV